MQASQAPSLLQFAEAVSNFTRSSVMRFDFTHGDQIFGRGPKLLIDPPLHQRTEEIELPVCKVAEVVPFIRVGLYIESSVVVIPLFPVRQYRPYLVEGKEIDGRSKYRMTVPNDMRDFSIFEILRNSPDPEADPV